MSRHLYRSNKVRVTLGLDLPLKNLFGFVQTLRAKSPKPLTGEVIPIDRRGLNNLFQLAENYGPIPDSCREALEREVDQFLAGIESHDCVVLHRNDCEVKSRLEELRLELRAERISYGELAELQSLRHYIQPDDIELLGALGEQE